MSNHIWKLYVSFCPHCSSNHCLRLHDSCTGLWGALVPQRSKYYRGKKVMIHLVQGICFPGRSAPAPSWKHVRIPTRDSRSLQVLPATGSLVEGHGAFFPQSKPWKQSIKFTPSESLSSVSQKDMDTDIDCAKPVCGPPPRWLGTVTLPPLAVRAQEGCPFFGPGVKVLF